MSLMINFCHHLANLVIPNGDPQDGFSICLSDFLHHQDSYTVELWLLELACLKHQGLLELVRRSRQFPYIFNVKIHPRLEQ